MDIKKKRGPKPKPKRINVAPLKVIDFPIDLRLRARGEAATRGQTFREFLIDMLNEHLGINQKNSVNS